MNRLVLACLALALVPAAAFAESKAVSVGLVNAWYAALSPANKLPEMQFEITRLLSDSATIELKDLNTIQTKAEFVESLEGWEAAIKGGRVSHKIDAASTMNNVIATACYDFGGNAVMTREVFDIVDMRITRSVQETIAERCDDF
ncbi:hypothetical protein [Ahrensia marina]|uniref:Uncharacterized protein n=1 Tax=Ahrensia marina TaxID=1514904 RepID=A0A0M9GKH5_9HYPH|nr:hypothetical protein [Ahrensia marina]KPA99906.1 hypothetical protein SU32_16690 [Ahrensia marina]